MPTLEKRGGNSGKTAADGSSAVVVLSEGAAGPPLNDRPQPIPTTSDQKEQQKHDDHNNNPSLRRISISSKSSSSSKRQRREGEEGDSTQKRPSLTPSSSSCSCLSFLPPLVKTFSPREDITWRSKSLKANKLFRFEDSEVGDEFRVFLHRDLVSVMTAIMYVMGCFFYPTSGLTPQEDWRYSTISCGVALLVLVILDYMLHADKIFPSKTSWSSSSSSSNSGQRQEGSNTNFEPGKSTTVSAGDALLLKKQKSNLLLHQSSSGGGGVTTSRSSPFKEIEQNPSVGGDTAGANLVRPEDAPGDHHHEGTVIHDDDDDLVGEVKSSPPPDPVQRRRNGIARKAIAIGMGLLIAMICSPTYVAYQTKNCKEATDFYIEAKIRPNMQFSEEEYEWYCLGSISPFRWSVITIGFLGLPLPPYILSLLHAFVWFMAVLLRLLYPNGEEETSRELAQRFILGIAASVMMVALGSIRYRNNLIQFVQAIIVKRETIEAEQREEDLENLLIAMLPPAALDRLTRGQTVADYTDEATVLFSDMVGFTSWSSTRSASEVVAMLNILCIEIDNVAALYEVEKVKTIGDAYWAVSGLPEVAENHAERICDFGNAMLDIVTKQNKKHKQWGDVQLRVGVHTGALCGGILGTQQLSYEVFGETSTLANQAESKGVPGKVVVSQTTLDALDLPPEALGVTEPHAVITNTLDKAVSVNNSPSASAANSLSLPKTGNNNNSTSSSSLMAKQQPVLVESTHVDDDDDGGASISNAIRSFNIFVLRRKKIAVLKEDYFTLKQETGLAHPTLPRNNDSDVNNGLGGASSSFYAFLRNDTAEIDWTTVDLSGSSSSGGDLGAATPKRSPAAGGGSGGDKSKGQQKEELKTETSVTIVQAFNGGDRSSSRSSSNGEVEQHSNSKIGSDSNNNDGSSINIDGAGKNRHNHDSKISSFVRTGNDNPLEVRPVVASGEPAAANGNGSATARAQEPLTIPSSSKAADGLLPTTPHVTAASGGIARTHLLAVPNIVGGGGGGGLLTAAGNATMSTQNSNPIPSASDYSSEGGSSIFTGTAEKSSRDPRANADAKLQARRAAAAKKRRKQFLKKRAKERKEIAAATSLRSAAHQQQQQPFPQFQPIDMIAAGGGGGDGAAGGGSPLVNDPFGSGVGFFGRSGSLSHQQLHSSRSSSVFAGGGRNTNNFGSSGGFMDSLTGEASSSTSAIFRPSSTVIVAGGGAGRTRQSVSTTSVVVTASPPPAAAMTGFEGGAQNPGETTTRRRKGGVNDEDDDLLLVGDDGAVGGTTLEPDSLEFVEAKYSQRKYPQWFVPLDDFADWAVEANYFFFAKKRQLPLRIASRIMVLVTIVLLLINTAINESSSSVNGKSDRNRKGDFSSASIAFFVLAAFIGIGDLAFCFIKRPTSTLAQEIDHSSMNEKQDAAAIGGSQSGEKRRRSSRNKPPPNQLEMMKIQAAKLSTVGNHLTTLFIFLAVGLMPGGSSMSSNDITYLHAFLTCVVDVGNVGLVSGASLVSANLVLFVPIYCVLIWKGVFFATHSVFLLQSNLAITFTVIVMEKQFRNLFLQQHIAEFFRNKQHQRNKEREALLASVVPNHVVKELVIWMESESSQLQAISHTYPKIVVGFVQLFKPVLSGDVTPLSSMRTSPVPQQQSIAAFAGASSAAGSAAGSPNTSPGAQQVLTNNYFLGTAGGGGISGSSSTFTTTSGHHFPSTNLSSEWTLTSQHQHHSNNYTISSSATGSSFGGAQQQQHHHSGSSHHHRHHRPSLHAVDTMTMAQIASIKKKQQHTTKPHEKQVYGRKEEGAEEGLATREDHDGKRDGARGHPRSAADGAAVPPLRILSDSTTLGDSSLIDTPSGGPGAVGYPLQLPSSSTTTSGIKGGHEVEGDEIKQQSSSSANTTILLSPTNVRNSGSGENTSSASAALTKTFSSSDKSGAQPNNTTASLTNHETNPAVATTAPHVFEGEAVDSGSDDDGESSSASASASTKRKRREEPVRGGDFGATATPGSIQISQTSASKRSNQEGGGGEEGVLSAGGRFLEREHWLQLIHTEVDKLLTKREFQGVCKIKTIGDIVMMAGPFPTPTDEELSQWTASSSRKRRKQKEEDQTNRWQNNETTSDSLLEQCADNLLAAVWHLKELCPVRAGLHTGEIVGAVLGTERLCFDIFGDTVNTASRTMTSGVQEDISLSKEFCQILPTTTTTTKPEEEMADEAPTSPSSAGAGVFRLRRKNTTAQVPDASGGNSTGAVPKDSSNNPSPQVSERMNDTTTGNGVEELKFSQQIEMTAAKKNNIAQKKKKKWKTDGLVLSDPPLQFAAKGKGIIEVRRVLSMPLVVQLEKSDAFSFGSPASQPTMKAGGSPAHFSLVSSTGPLVLGGNATRGGASSSSPASSFSSGPAAVIVSDSSHHSPFDHSKGGGAVPPALALETSKEIVPLEGSEKEDNDDRDSYYWGTRVEHQQQQQEAAIPASDADAEEEEEAIVETAKSCFLATEEGENVPREGSNVLVYSNTEDILQEEQQEEGKDTKK